MEKLTNIMIWAFAILVALLVWPLIIGLIVLAIDIGIVVLITLFIVSLLKHYNKK